MQVLQSSFARQLCGICKGATRSDAAVKSLTEDDVLSELCRAMGGKQLCGTCISCEHLLPKS